MKNKVVIFVMICLLNSRLKMNAVKLCYTFFLILFFLVNWVLVMTHVTSYEIC